MKLRYTAQIIDEDTDEVLAQVSSYSLEGLEEEMGKSKFKVEEICESCGDKVITLQDGSLFTMRGSH